MNCAYHNSNLAAVRCSRCSRALCPACDHRIRGFPYCQDCIVAGVELLQRQGTRTAPPLEFRGRKTSPLVALLLSVVPGLGAAYNGQASKALVHFAIYATFFQMAVVTDGVLFFVLGVIGSWLFSAVDAYRTAQLIRSGLAPDVENDAIARRLYGSPLAWGVLLVILGSVFLLRAVFNIKLPAAQILPLVLVVLGLYLLSDYLRNRRDRDLPGFEITTAPPSVVSSLNEDGTGELVTQVSARVQNERFFPRV